MIELFRIVETDNFGRDYPNEQFVNIPLGTREEVQKIANIINDIFCNYDGAPRYWKVVPNGYKLQPGFEP